MFSQQVSPENCLKTRQVLVSLITDLNGSRLIFLALSSNRKHFSKKKICSGKADFLVTTQIFFLAKQKNFGGKKLHHFFPTLEIIDIHPHFVFTLTEEKTS